MTAVLVRPKVQDMVAWQYTGQPQSERPKWVQACCSLDFDGNLLHRRRSGLQAVNLTDWLVRDLDGGIVFYTDDEMQRKFDFQGVGR